MPSSPCPQCPPKGSRNPSSTVPNKIARDCGYYDRGYICCVHESLDTVVQHILKDSDGIRDNAFLRKQIVDQLKRCTDTNPARRMGKKRPCVLLSIVHPDQNTGGPNGPQICVMGTFGGKLPKGRVYLHFCIPVFPNCGLESDSSGKRSHMHACPRDWKHCKQWVVAFAYRSTSAILGTWRASWPRARTATTPQVWLDKQNQAWLMEQCVERLDEWSALCKANPGFARGCAFEHQVGCLVTRCVRDMMPNTRDFSAKPGIRELHVGSESNILLYMLTDT